MNTLDQALAVALDDILKHRAVALVRSNDPAYKYNDGFERRTIPLTADSQIMSQLLLISDGPYELL